MEELVEAGKEGLKIASKKFDPSRKFKLSPMLSDTSGKPFSKQ
jgi:hypothetical protein